MVLVQSYGRPPAPQRPNSARVTGLSLAIAFNVVMLLAASVLMKPPLFLQPPSTSIVAVDIPVEKPRPPLPPEIVPMVERQQPAPAPRPEPAQRSPVPDTRPQPIATGPAIDTSPPTFTPPETGGASDPGAAGPVAGVRLEYASAPPPRYSADLIRDRAEGTVLLQVLVDANGKPLEVTIHRSSGNRRLDRLAQQHVLDTWSFRPAMRNGHAVQAIGLVPIDFRLD